jgi:hypothetical protein
MQYNSPLYKSIVSQKSCFVNGKRSKINRLRVEISHLENIYFID